VDIGQLRARLPIFVVAALVVLILVMLGFACVCFTDHPAQALERVLAAMASLPPLVDMWIAAGFLAFGMASNFRRQTAVPCGRSPASLQRFLF
jgi:hypothetical protein